MKNLLTASIIALAATSPVFAVVPPPTQLSYYDSDTRTNSASTPDAFASPGDTNPGSLKFSTGAGPGTPGNNNKVAVTFYQPGATPLGTLGTLNNLTFDYYLDSASTGTGGTLAPAVRLKLSPLGTPSATYVDLVYEPVYQNSAGWTSPKDAWQNDVNVIGSSLLWQRSNGVNHDGYPDFQTLSSFVGGYTPTYNGAGVTLDANTPIYGVEVSLGSGLPNNFTAYIDDVNVGFSNGNSFTANVPEPASLALVGVGSAALLMRRRRAARA